MNLMSGHLVSKSNLQSKHDSDSIDVDDDSFLTKYVSTPITSTPIFCMDDNANERVMRKL